MAKIEPVHILGVAIGNYTNLDEGDENGVLWGFKTNDVCRRIFPKELIKYLDEYSHLSPLSISIKIDLSSGAIRLVIAPEDANLYESHLYTIDEVKWFALFQEQFPR